jgi:hypothetical protein
MRGTPRRPPDGEWEGTWLGEGVRMDHGKGAGTTDAAPVGPAGDAGPMRPGGTKTPLRPYVNQSQSLKTPVSGSEEL